jgi:hypothetical protein
MGLILTCWREKNPEYAVIASCIGATYAIPERRRLAMHAPACHAPGMAAAVRHHAVVWTCNPPQLELFLQPICREINQKEVE